MMTVLSDPVNLIDTIEPDSSMSYIRRVVSRILGHAIADGIDWKDARDLWSDLGFDPDRYPDYLPSIQAAATA